MLAPSRLQDRHVLPCTTLITRFGTQLSGKAEAHPSPRPSVPLGGGKQYTPWSHLSSELGCDQDAA